MNSSLEMFCLLISRISDDQEREVVRFRNRNKKSVNLAVARDSLDHLLEILDTPPKIVASPNGTLIRNVRREIRFDDGTFSFARSNTVPDYDTLQVGAGEKLAIVGASGSGKSTA